METRRLLASSAAMLSQLHVEFLEAHARFYNSHFGMSAHPIGPGLQSSRCLRNGGSKIGLVTLVRPDEGADTYFDVFASYYTDEQISPECREAAEHFVELARRAGEFLPTELKDQIAERHRILPDDAWYPPFLDPSDIWLELALRDWNESYGPYAGWSSRAHQRSAEISGALSRTRMAAAMAEHSLILDVPAPFESSARVIERLIVGRVAVEPDGASATTAAASVEDRAIGTLATHRDWSKIQIAQAIGTNPKYLSDPRHKRFNAAWAALHAREIPRGSKSAKSGIEAVGDKDLDFDEIDERLSR